MVVSVSLVVVGRDFRPALDGLVESVDQQSLPTSDFEVVMVDQGSTDGTLDRLRQLVTHRPNIRLIQADANGQADWLQVCSGDYVLPMSADRVLFPEALERLYAFAAEHELDVVSARCVHPGAAVADVLLADSSTLDPPARASALHGPAVLLRRSVAKSSAGYPADYLGESVRVGVLSSYPAVRMLAGAGPDALDDPSVRLDPADVAIAWKGSQLHLDVSGTAAASSSDLDLAGARPVALLRRSSSGLTFVVEQGGELTQHLGLGESPQWSWDLSIDLDVRTAALGSALASGLWEVDVQLANTTFRSVPATIGWAACPAAVIETTVVVPSPVETETWQLDVGPTTWPLVAEPDIADATVTESVAGSVLALDLPRVHVSGSAVIAGKIALDQLPLAARIITDGSSARLEAFVSGLPGSPRIATRFGKVAMHQTGLCLEISGSGDMEVSTYKPPVAKPPAPKPSAPKRRAPKPLTRAQHLRRALPKQLEPLAERIAKSPRARKLYRRIAHH